MRHRTSPASRRQLRHLVVAGIAALALPATAVTATAADDGRADNTADGATFDRFIVEYEKNAPGQHNDRAAERSADRAAANRGRDMRFERRMGGGAAVMSSDRAVGRAEAERLIAELERRGDIAHAELDLLLQATATPNDPRYSDQWHYDEPTGGLNLPGAWDTHDGTGAVVAVIDTGITAHPDLDANVVGGYDFISDSGMARDGDGRDSDPSDEGDWYSNGQCGGPGSSDSSWHGTHVAGTVAAVTNNSTGVAGVAYGASVVPVRVLGKCGGYTSDIADAIRWSSGGTVSGVPSNANPADVINLSLGGSGSCSSVTQSAIDAANTNGTTVVVAAGNSNTNASNSNPANCNGVLTVAATDRNGDRAYYSNYGSVVDVAAPGGDTPSGTSNGVLSTLNTGTTTPASPTYAYYQGTSMATPHVAGLAALVVDADPTLTPSQVTSQITSNARAFPGTCSQCGSGIADAAATIASVTGGGTEPPPSGGGSYTNDTDVAIPDRGFATSTIESTESGNGPADLEVSVNIDHTYRGDLVIDLVAPDGASVRLKDSDGWDSADDVVETWIVDATAVPAGGTWTLEVEDVYSGDTGTILSWSLNF